MTPEASKHIPNNIQQIFFSIKQIMERLPDIDLGRDRDRKDHNIVLSCHMVCEALARIFPKLEHKIGYFQIKGFEHSWLLHPVRQPYQRFIIDPYPWATLGGPLLLVVGAGTPWSRSYNEADINIDMGSPQFLACVENIYQVMLKIR